MHDPDTNPLNSNYIQLHVFIMINGIYGFSPFPCLSFPFRVTQLNAAELYRHIRFVFVQSLKSNLI